MPKKLHDRLERQAARQGLRGEDKNAYVYGTMDKIKTRRERKRRRSLFRKD